MKRINYHLIIIALLSFTVSQAQQLPQFTQYMFNTISINPAYAGSREAISVVGLHRSQWAGIINKAPNTQTLSIHSPLRNDKIGLGVSFIKDELGYENFTYLYGDFSYTIPVGDETELAFGLKAGFTQYSLDSDFRAEEYLDQEIAGIANRWNPNIGAGLFLHSNKWYIGASAPRILNTDYNGSKFGNLEFKALERVSYYLTGGYVFNFSENTKFKPAALIKATNGAPLSFDISANFLFYEKLWIGPSYRVNNSTDGWGSYGALIDFQVSEQLRIGYAYERPHSELHRFAGATHEVLVIFELKRGKKRVKSPRYF